VSISRLLGRNGRDSKEKVNYIRVLSHDGRKEVDFDKFLKRPAVREQMKRFRQQIIEPQRQRAQGQK
jgi:hypothetical protein